MRKTPKERFDSKLKVTPGCWWWTGSRMKTGYGLFYFDGRIMRAHRVSYVLYVGDFANHLVIRHRCDNPSCVNPDHLVPGTHQDNARDRQARGRASDRKGELHPRARLSAAQVLAIRNDKRTHREIGADYAITRFHVTAIKRGTRWSHI